MPEKHYLPREIEEEIEEHKRSPRSREGAHPELLEDFGQEMAQEPLERQEIEQEAAEFIRQNLADVFDFLLAYVRSDNDLRNVNLQKCLERFGLTNDEIALRGGGLTIRTDESGERKLFRTELVFDNERWDNVEREREDAFYTIESAELIALLWAKRNVRVDRTPKGVSSKFPHRFYLLSKGRYLCKNDYGTVAWELDENRREQSRQAEVYELGPILRTIQQQFARIQDNLGELHSFLFQEEMKNRGFNSSDGGYGWTSTNADFEDLDDTQMAIVADSTREEAEKEAEKRIFSLLSDEKAGDLISRGVSSGKVTRQLHFKYGQIAKKLGLTSNNPATDYERFGRNKGRLQRLFTAPSPSKVNDSQIPFVESEFYDRPVLFLDERKQGNLVKNAESGIQELLAVRAAEVDPNFAELFKQKRCGRGEQSPYNFSAMSLYEMLRALGKEKAEAVLASDDRDVFRQVSGWEILQKMGFDLTKMEPDKIKKQLFEAHKLQEKGLWSYLESREAETVSTTKARLGQRAEGKDWMELLGVRRSRDLFFEGKRMYWLAQQVFTKNPNHAEGDKFYQQWVEWAKYDLSEFDVPEERLNEHFTQSGNFIVALLGESEQRNMHDPAEEQQGRPASLGLIIQALERGQDLRGVALTFDKRRYLNGVIEGYEGEDLDFALSDWPKETRAAVSKEEVKMYYEYASDYVLRDPNGLTRYATWRASAEGKEWDKVFGEKPESKSDLDFRLCLGSQVPEVRGWYKAAAEYVGGTVVQSYLLRFNATRDTNGRFANWHDVLFWVPYIKNLEVGEARAILTSIQTMDENNEFRDFLPRYSKKRDKFLAQGAVQSLRELKKRVFAIESNLDLSDLPPQVLDITSAPGFNMSELERMSRQGDFRRLVDGELDKEQPFEPHRRIFAGRPLGDSLKEGLGSQKAKIRGTAKDPKGLFHDLRQMIKGRKVGEKPIEVTDLFSAVPLDLEEDVIGLLQKQGVDTGPVVEAQVHAKSDPEGWVCGNYTDCCMPFGASNNNDYMFNPSTQYFTIKYNGRIIAQSVVVDSRDSRGGGDVVVLDNIEIANNYKNLSPLVARVYQTFWAEYTSRPVKVGTGYSDLVPPGGRLESNRYSSKTHLVYSDAQGGQIYDLPKIRGVEALDEMVTFANLTERDAELIAKLEAEIYPQGMTQGKAHIADILKKQRELEVPGAASSFVIRQGSDAVGYLLVLPEESEINSGEQAAHVYDMAIHPKFQGKGLAKKMMERVLDIASSYNMPIEAEARASTSYAMIMNEGVRQWFGSRGFTLSSSERMDKYMGDEDFYYVRFDYNGRPVEEEE